MLLRCITFPALYSAKNCPRLQKIRAGQSKMHRKARTLPWWGTREWWEKFPCPKFPCHTRQECRVANEFEDLEVNPRLDSHRWSAALGARFASRALDNRQQIFDFCVHFCWTRHRMRN